MSEAPLKRRAEETVLWKKLQDFDLDGDAPLSFSKRLARENGWRPEFAGRVVEEYRKFLFLARECGHPVTPSEAVDQAWHQHLCYTRSYWDEMCSRVLERPLHHDPTRGGREESEKFVDWYEKTLDSYREWFHVEPPGDIWPPSAARFGDERHFRRVNTRRFWLVPRPAIPTSNLRCVWRLWQRADEALESQSPTVPSQAMAVGLLCLSVVLFLAGDAQQVVGAGLERLNVWDWNGPDFLFLFWSLCALGLIAIIAARKMFALPDDSQLPRRELDAFEIARLNESGDLPIDAALASLHRRGAIQIRPRGQVDKRSSTPPSHPWEREVWEGISYSRSTLHSIRVHLRPKLARFDAPLQSMGLLIEPSLARFVARLSVGIPLVLLAMGVGKIVVGLSRGKPVGFLVLSCIVLVAAAIWLAARAVRRSGRGTKYLRTARGFSSHVAVRSQARVDPGAVALAVAVWGYGELDAVGMPEVRQAMRPVSSSGGDGGSGGDSGGGDGGSGCGGGGCGGCGGS